MCIMLGTEKYRVWPLPRAHHFQCVTYIRFLLKAEMGAVCLVLSAVILSAINLSTQEKQNENCKVHVTYIYVHSCLDFKISF